MVGNVFKLAPNTRAVTDAAAYQCQLCSEERYVRQQTYPYSEGALLLFLRNWQARRQLEQHGDHL